ncbi:hypothetical protein M514_08797 [Trichuris suis]|uniref:Uncharacterized protein n=1 Tax=Trichuris suis TaxID=68888 RepID=A0A085NJ95_9BILA|nr:hypothetical protein M513_08797 [Trichuris suis]KFD69541.1 hypothetical protein M514_08797 [Trichuris suis]
MVQSTAGEASALCTIRSWSALFGRQACVSYAHSLSVNTAQDCAKTWLALKSSMCSPAFSRCRTLSGKPVMKAHARSFSDIVEELPRESATVWSVP